MAIKTKKISDLECIDKVTDDVCFLGTNSSITGKISASSIKDFVSFDDTKIKQELSTVQSDIEYVKECLIKIQNVQHDINNIKTSISQLQEKIESISIPESSCDLTGIEQKVSAMEGFMMALQKDGYLTLKEIQRAAADACPICNHTHEETAE